MNRFGASGRDGGSRSSAFFGTRPDFGCRNVLHAGAPRENHLSNLRPEFFFRASPVDQDDPRRVGGSQAPVAICYALVELTLLTFHAIGRTLAAAQTFARDFLWDA